MIVKSLLDSGVCSLSAAAPDMFMDEVIDMMPLYDVTAVCVTGPFNQALGILTDHDILKAIDKRGMTGNSINGEYARDWMSEYLVTCSTKTSLSKAARLMRDNNIHHLVVTDDGQYIAIISLSDVLTHMHIQDELQLHKIRSGITVPAKPPLSSSAAA